MARHGDKGAYEIGNIKFITVSQNCSEKRVSDVGRAKLSEANRDNKYSVGRVVSRATRAKISAALKGISRNVGAENPMFGHVYTVAERMKLSQAQTLAWQRRRTA